MDRSNYIQLYQVLREKNILENKLFCCEEIKFMSITNNKASLDKTETIIKTLPSRSHNHTLIIKKHDLNVPTFLP
jgi:hypothetical protein